MLTTKTGQTGKDAYIYEATAIANAKRELDRKFKALVKTMQEENPELFENKSDFAWANSESAEGFSVYLTGRENYIKWLRNNR